MAKWTNVPITDKGFWCDPRKCGNCNDNYDYCQCNNDNATSKFCEDCVNAGLAPDWNGVTKKRRPRWKEANGIR